MGPHLPVRALHDHRQAGVGHGDHNLEQRGAGDDRATLIQGITSFSLTQLLSKAAQRLIAELRRKVQAHIGRLPVAFYDATKSGTLVSRIMSDVEIAFRRLHRATGRTLHVPTLAERLRRGPLPPQQVLKSGIEIGQDARRRLDARLDRRQAVEPALRSGKPRARELIARAGLDRHAIDRGAADSGR